MVATSVLEQVVHLLDMPSNYHMRFQYQNNQVNFSHSRASDTFLCLTNNGVHSKSAFVGRQGPV